MEITANENDINEILQSFHMPWSSSSGYEAIRFQRFLLRN